MAYTRTHRSAGLLRLLGLCIVAFGLALLSGRPASSKVHPYYVVQGASLGQISPRILFVLDTSGSMALRAQANEEICAYNQCEEGAGTQLSRIAAARQALRAVIDKTKDKAKFALMTFDQQRPPTSNPGKCNGRRFRWVDAYQLYFFGPLTWLSHYAGYNGHWMLCESGSNQPYPYLRWDNLGVGQHPATKTSKANGPVPPSPLISTAQSDMKSSANAYRKVQWFGRFLGVRFHADCSDPVINDLKNKSRGDWKKNQVCGHDWYYWPYVDGFPGYSAMTGYRCGSKNCSYKGRLGVVEDSWPDSATLYSPFYLDLDPVKYPPSKFGPTSEADADTTTAAMVAPMIEGGVDADGGTPWTDAIGSVNVTPPDTNAHFGHTTVASYLKFVNEAETPDLCAPTAAVLVTDGQPNCAQGWPYDCSTLYRRLSDLRTELGVETYVVGFLEGSYVLNRMACAAAGSCKGGCGNNPCGGTPADDWDTCQDPNDHWNKCAFVTSSPDELADAVTEIIDGVVQTDVSSGPGATVNDFGVGAKGNIGEGEQLQSKVNAWTDWPEWRGHVTRELCDDQDVFDIDEDGDTTEVAPYCVPPVPEWQPEELEETFGPCPQSHEWDAGECLQLTDWKARRIYSSDASGNLYRISDASGNASPKFVNELVARGVISAPNTQAKANKIAQFILGKDFPDDWKLPGLANSAPVVVRRIPRFNENFVPAVPIRDPHCAGRFLDAVTNTQIPMELKNFAIEAWDETKKINTPSKHWEYQEAVLVGDDIGVLHAFQWNSGNELWGYIPPFLFGSAKAQADIGPATMGQPKQVADHIYGLASTVNHGWVYDPNTDAYRHVGVFGMGKGGTELVALDLSHMSPSSPKGPFEVLWTTEDPLLKSAYDDINGETWARPALTYDVPGDDLANNPTSQVVFGTGYQPGTFDPNDEKGRVLVMADAITGQILEQAELPKVTSPVYEVEYGTIVDPAVGSHCRSRYWAEKQETYVVDPAGRLFRWDLGAGANHESDSGGKWNGQALPLAEFPACTGTGKTCSVKSNNKRDVFVFGPAVTALNRIDTGQTGNPDTTYDDQFLIALASGSPNEDKIDWSVDGNDFHSSLYILVDDHKLDKKGGLSVPNGAPKAPPGTNAKYMRIALSDIERQRTFTPYPGASEITEPPAPFSRRARPIRPPKIKVTGTNVDNGGGFELNDQFEIMEVEFTVYEPGPGECDPRFYDQQNDTWYFDEGSVYVITFRLTVDDTKGFDFTNGAGGGIDFNGIPNKGLTLVSVEQVTGGACEDGVCGPVPQDGPRPTCDPNQPTGGGGVSMSLPLRRAELDGFTPIE
ncbi:MAG: type IV pilin biogenesis protein [Deltaproteobacteria bacterium]|nr:MAG: type IV pilin biogenesis protein [Deltaproteobacteria bacterium]